MNIVAGKKDNSVVGVNSLLAEDYKKFSIVCVGDGSSPRTAGQFSILAYSARILD